MPSEIITPYKSLQKRFGDKVKIDYFKGTDVVTKLKDGPSFAQIAAQAGKADVILFVGGINAHYEGEEGDANQVFDGFYRGDRTSIKLPSVQTDLLKVLKKNLQTQVFLQMIKLLRKLFSSPKKWNLKDLHTIVINTRLGWKMLSGVDLEHLFCSWMKCLRHHLTYKAQS
jgi:hypothetical protein